MSGPFPKRTAIRPVRSAGEPPSAPLRKWQIDFAPLVYDQPHQRITAEIEVVAERDLGPTTGGVGNAFLDDAEDEGEATRRDELHRLFVAAADFCAANIAARDPVIQAAIRCGRSAETAKVAGCQAVGEFAAALIARATGVCVCRAKGRLFGAALFRDISAEEQDRGHRSAENFQNATTPEALWLRSVPCAAVSRADLEAAVLAESAARRQPRGEVPGVAGPELCASGRLIELAAIAVDQDACGRHIATAMLRAIGAAYADAGLLLHSTNAWLSRAAESNLGFSVARVLPEPYLGADVISTFPHNGVAVMYVPPFATIAAVMDRAPQQ